MNRIIFLTFIAWLLSLVCHAQQPADFRVQKFNTENGLPSNGIKGMQWDDQSGFLWIATEAGIVRYNGMEFKVFSKEDGPSFNNERVLFMVKNNEEKIYCADNRGNLFYVQENRLKFVEKKKLNSDSGNNLISISVSDQLYRSKIDFRKEIFALQYDQTLSISDTGTFVIHARKLYYYSQTVTSPLRVSNVAMEISYGFKCGEDIFLLDAEKNIFLLEKSTQILRIDCPVEDSGFSKIDWEEGNLLWESGMKNPILINKQKAWLLSYSNGKITPSLICNGIPEDLFIRYVQFDERSKILFIGSDSKGIIAVRQNHVKSLKPEIESLNVRSSYYSQVELPRGNVLTNEGHVIGNTISSSTRIPIKGRFGTNTFLIGDSILWFTKPDPARHASSHFLHSYDFNTGKTKVYPKIPEIYQLLMVTSGKNTYIANDRGIYKLESDSLRLLYPYNVATKSGMDYDMKEIAPGILAIANCNSLLRFDIKLNKLDTLYGPGNYCFRAIWKYKDYVFLGSYGGGLFIYKNGIIKPLPLDKNKYLLFTHCFVKDENGFCWISTNRGLFKADLSELIDVFEKNANDVYYYYYGKNDGMDMTELNGGCSPCALVKIDKTFSFPTMDGLLWVNPETATSALPYGEIYIDDILVENQLINPDSFRLKQLSSKEEIIIRLAIPAWSNKENIYVDYKLNEEAWRPIDIEKGMEIHFNNLQPGDYKLLIRKRKGFGLNNYSYRQLEFFINTPWYRKWWSYLLIVGLIAGIFRLYFNIRTRQLRMKQWRLELQVAEKTKELQLKNEVLEKNDTIKTRLISIISHDIVTPLKFLTAAGKNIVEKRDLMSEDLQDETLREMINTSQELQLLSTNILNWIKYQNENRRLAKENFNVHELTNHVLGVLKSLAKQKNLDLRNEIPTDLSIYQYYEPLKILIYNLISNAINFTERGNITIGNVSVDGETIIYVKDQGVGMSAEQIQNILADQFIVSSTNVDKRKGNGLGYLIIKDLLKMMGGHLSIQSEMGKGTTASIVLKSGSSS